MKIDVLQMDSVTHHLRFGIGPWTGSFCSALVRYSVKRRTNPFLAPAGERGGFVFSLACFLEKGPALSNTRQGRECLSISRRSATVRLCRRKIALPRYQFGLNLSAFHPDIYVASGCPAHRSPVHSQKKHRVGRAERLFRETWFISVERCSHPEKAQALACAAGELC
jgi:hypothetical protein